MSGSLVTAVAIALSPFAVIPAILVLFSPRPRPTAAAFLSGWALGVGSATAIAVLLADLVELTDSTPTWVAWARIGLGVALVLYGSRSWLTRHGDAEPPGWMRSLQDAQPRRAIGLGLVLSSANPKVLLLAVAGGLAIGTDGPDAAAELVAVVVFTAVASSTVAAPLLGYLAAGERALPLMERANAWLERHNRAVVAVVLLVIGLLLVASGMRSV
jgi:threonine/homoserine/homoserine lactone efflux protein